MITIGKSHTTTTTTIQNSFTHNDNSLLTISFRIVLNWMHNIHSLNWPIVKYSIHINTATKQPVYLYPLRFSPLGTCVHIFTIFVSFYLFFCYASKRSEGWHKNTRILKQNKKTFLLSSWNIIILMLCWFLDGKYKRHCRIFSIFSVAVYQMDHLNGVEHRF